MNKNDLPEVRQLKIAFIVLAILGIVLIVFGVAWLLLFP